MKKLTFLVLILSLTLGSCQSKYPDLKEGIYAEFITSKGSFVAKLHHEQAPLTVSNFIDLAEGNNEMVDSIYKGKKFYNGLIFHRIIKDFMIQGGDPLGTGSGNPGYKFPDETTQELQHSKKGILSMANSGPGTNGSQFFITLKETPWLNGKHTVFGEIAIGQDIVDALGSVEVANGSKPVETVTMLEVNIINVGGVKLHSFKEGMVIIEKKKKKSQDQKAKIAAGVAKEFNSIIEKAEELPSGLKKYIITEGTEVQPKLGDKVLVYYAGYLTDGSLFDSNMIEVAKRFEVWDHVREDGGGYKPTPMDYSLEAKLISGFREGLLSMKVGEKATFFIPAHLGYGERGYPPVIPPSSDLIFELEIVEIVSPK
ncbi:MAG: cyclophilin family peptidyl-prolyl cis-trans isomerase [Flavobacteriaceae bacterium]|jgi:cyclophilin family peptidyl-prolyl cis-trans isomerase|uniref:peptidylprolyl isomerase n=1 Tax=Candidatus Marifrigoribacter sp. Uisw_064 TaxID=3230970 RepID=UPI003ADD443F